MEAIVTAIIIYAIIGLLICLVLSFRSRKYPKAMMAAGFFGLGGAFEFPILLLFWPLFLLVQLVEEKNLSDQPEEKKDTIKEKKSYDACIGTSVTALMPTGIIEIDEELLEAVSDEGSIERGKKIEVVGISMNALKVRKFQQNAAHYGGSCNAPV